MVSENWEKEKVSLGLDVVVEKYLTDIFHGMFCNQFLNLWKAKAEKLYRN